MRKRILGRVLLIVFMSVSLNASLKLSKQQCIDHNSAKGCYDFAIDLIEKTGHDNGDVSDVDIWKLAIDMMDRSCAGGYAESCTFLYELSMKNEASKNAQYYLERSCRLGNTSACRLLK